MDGNLTTELSQLVQALYGGARRLAPDTFQDWALNQVKSIIPFDSGKWVTGAVHNEQAIVHNIHLHNQPPRMNPDYAKYQYQDRLLAELIKTRGEVKTYSMYDTISRKEFIQTDLYTKYCKHYGQEHLISSAVPEPLIKLFTVISFYRKNFGHPFSEDEKKLKTFLTPILVDTRKVNIFLHMNASKPNQNSVSAICDMKGVLREAESSFFDMIIKQWPDWQPPVFPLEPKKLLGDKSEAAFHGKQIVIRMQPWSDLVHITVRNKCTYDRLTPTEQQVARHLTHGLSNKEIASRLDISPKTVDNHLQHIYQKFGVCNRQRTVAAMAAVEFGENI